MIVQDWLPLRPTTAPQPTDGESAPGGTRLLWLACSHTNVEAYLNEALAAVAHAMQADYVALAAADQGRWQLRAEVGRSRALPRDFLGEVLDRGEVGQVTLGDVPWLGSPLEPRASAGEVLLVADYHTHSSRDVRSTPAAHLAALAPMLAAGVEEVRTKARDAARIARLEAVLDIAGQWNQARETEPLLVMMAEAACRLLGADRASIFLWDRNTRQLVGRPALGVEGGELRVADDAGVVGYVMQTGQPRRVSEQIASELIDRNVDQRTGYQTRNLICVPLNGRDGQRFGVFEVLNKRQGHFTAQDETALTELAEHAAIALENTQEREALLHTRRQMTEEAAQRVQIIGESEPIKALRSTIQRVAKTELAVLVLGENGTGKEVVSQAIHYLSDRRDQPFIAVNCAALTETLLESELFGHEKGAFTDAHDTRPGKFELASGGTLFLDEIGDMSLGGQAKLLRVLEEKVVVRVGGSTNIHTDARVLAATNQDLQEMVREKKFRQDLYFRLAVVTLDVPPLRERPDDILLLAEHFLADFSRKARRKKIPRFSAEARKRLQAHSWPGNVRELRNLMERIAYLTAGEKIEPDDLAFIMPSRSSDMTSIDLLDMPLTDATHRFQTEYIQKAINRASGNMTAAAELLGLHRSNLYRKMRQLKMDTDEEEM